MIIEEPYGETEQSADAFTTNWNSNTGNYTIHCIGVDIPKGG